MREITKNLSLPGRKEMMNFRISKLDAFSGARLLKLLSAYQDESESSESFSLSDFLFSLPDEDFDRVMKICLSHAEIQLPAGFIPVYREGCWGLPDLEYEMVVCLKLTLEVMAWSLEGFFPETGRTSPREAVPSSR